MSTGAAQRNQMLFWALLAYFFVEYLRPQDLVPAVRVLKPGLLLSLVLILGWMVRGRKLDAVQPPLIYLVAFWLVGSASVLFAVNTFKVYLTFETFGLYILSGCLATILVLDSEPRIRTFMYYWVGINALLGLYAIGNKGVGTGSFLTDENDLALAMNMALPYAYFLGLQADNDRRKKILFLTAAVIMVAAIVASNSRGGFVGLLVVLGAIVWYSRRRLRNAAAIVVAGAIGLLFVPASYWEEMQTITDTEESTADDRLWSWEMGWDMFTDHPVLGIGFRNYGYNVAEYERRHPDYDPRTMKLHGGRAAHSLYFTLLPETGLVGTFLYFMFCLGLYRMLREVNRAVAALPDPGEELRRMDALARAMIASAAAYFACGLFLSVLYYPHMIYFAGFAIAVHRRTMALTQTGSPA